MRFYSCLVIILLTIFSLSAQSDWELKKSESNIEVYVREVADTDFLEFKGVTTFDCTTETVFNLLRDFPNWKNWGYKIAKIEVLKTESPVEFFVYNEVDMPWPMNNRDMVNHIRMTKNKLTGEARVIMQSTADFIPEKPEIIRLQDGQGFYQLDPTPDGKTKITYQYFTNPQGVPAWVVNLFITDSPFATLIKMREEVKKAKYITAP